MNSTDGRLNGTLCTDCGRVLDGGPSGFPGLCMDCEGDPAYDGERNSDDRPPDNSFEGQS
jgi:hypothetical protein